jgi:hypothetical protein
MYGGDTMYMPQADRQQKQAQIDTLEGLMPNPRCFFLWGGKQIHTTQKRGPNLCPIPMLITYA